MYKAKERYNKLSSGRTQFLDMAVECSELTLPYLITRDDNFKGKRQLLQPWQSVGAKGVVTLASKLMLGLLPPSTTFFKLQLPPCHFDTGNARIIFIPGCNCHGV